MFSIVTTTAQTLRALAPIQIATLWQKKQPKPDDPDYWDSTVGR